MSDATFYFLRGVKELKLAEDLIRAGKVSEGLKVIKSSFTYLAKSYLLLSGKAFIGISNPHYIASILYDLGHEDIFRLVSLAEVEAAYEGRSAELYISACRRLLELIGLKDTYLNVNNRTYLF